MRSCNSVLLAAILVVWALPSFAQIESPKEAPTKPGDYKFIFKTRIDGKPIQMTYVLILPKGYDTKPIEKFPMVVFTHGAGECGTDGEAVYYNGPALELKNNNPFKDTFPFIVLCPQCPPRGERWDQPAMFKAVSEIVDKAIISVRVDPDRVYLTGLSMGGKGCWLAALEGAERFAAIAPICAGTVHPDAAQKLRYVAVWMIGGSLDPEAVDANNKMFGVLKDNLAEVRNTIVPGADHGVWPAFYASPQFYEWLLSHKRPNAAERRQMDAAGPYLRRQQAPPRAQGHYRLTLPVEINGQPVLMVVSIYVPKSYSPIGQPSPLLLFLHEYHTIGVPSKDLTLHGPDEELQKKGNETFRNGFPFIVVSPQLPAGQGTWDQKPIQDAVIKCLDELTKSMNVDKTRIYATGLNEGGAAAWQLALNAPDRFTALAPIIAKGAYLPPGDAAEKLKNIANWTSINQDERASIDALNNVFKNWKAEWKLSPVPKITLDEMNAAYKNPDLYAWLLKQKKSK